MKKSVLALLFSAALVTVTNTASAIEANTTNTRCLVSKYDAYIDASLTWYQDLVSITTDSNPELKEVGDWFLQGRTHHFELNRAAVDYYLENEPAKVAIDEQVESWLKLTQVDVKALSQRDDELGSIAKATFDDRQSIPNEKNYELRSAFADLLSHPSNIKPALDKYNQAVAAANKIQCQ
ncbi:hypothetical protein [Vibrio gangliei]|uniref:hypothetical protein n=1 Tax=Vibrio gangliei TaxID=2077090 RepID=UPI000D0191DC|nr:hypothetical protein [Vibrio gangliei]